MFNQSRHFWSLSLLICTVNCCIQVFPPKYILITFIYRELQHYNIFSCYAVTGFSRLLIIYVSLRSELLPFQSSSLSKTVQGLRPSLACSVTCYSAVVSWILAGDPSFLGHSQGQFITHSNGSHHSTLIFLVPVTQSLFPTGLHDQGWLTPVHTVS